jgi:hypothetical protein
MALKRGEVKKINIKITKEPRMKRLRAVLLKLPKRYQ